MDNLALANVVQSSTSGAVPAGSAVNGAGVETNGEGSFGQVLAKQIAASEHRATSISDAAERFPSAQNQIQPVDLIMEIVSPATLSAWVDEVVQLQDVAVEGGEHVALSRFGLPGLDEDESLDAKGAEPVFSDAGEVPNLAQVVGNVQPIAAASGKELPPSAEADDARAIPLPSARDLGTSQALPKNDATRPLAGLDADGVPKELFSAQLDQAATSQGSIRGAQDASAHLAVNSSSIIPVTQRIANAAPSSAGIPQQVGTPHWDTGLGDRVVWMIGSQMQTAQLHLNPPALGPLEVRVSMSDGQANLTFLTQQLVVKEAIDAATPRLREMMTEGGVQMGSVSVNVGNFSQQQQPAQQQGESSLAQRTEIADADVLQEQAVSTTVLSDEGGLVNLFA